MVNLVDYLYNGDTIFRILHKYSSDLKESALKTHNKIDLEHCNFLIRLSEILEHNDFLTSQSQRIREFYKYMADTYPFLAFTFKGRIKSLIRAEEKFNGYIMSDILDYHRKTGDYPSVPELRDKVRRFHDLIAYRIVISMPKCHLKPGQNQEEEEIKYLYEIANILPEFLEERGFSAELSGLEQKEHSKLMNQDLYPYYKDYIANMKKQGYRSLHITFFDNTARCYIELQLRTKEMDDLAEIGEANHSVYEQIQNTERAKRKEIPAGDNVYFDQAYERGLALQNIDFSKIDVNMFTAYDNYRINDGCGLLRGRLILPYEHLSRFQNDLID
ncbi:MAG: guanosine polyphosphate pyrophosphohydrolase [Lachnospiraceae bacterium]|nr:guanosine polyphosphate pyrophosphohydrolase [Lachnospiraceae bacterium]